MANRIREDLIEAYMGNKEDHYKASYDLYVKKEASDGVMAVVAYEVWARVKAIDEIRGNTNRERLWVYCEWNGIIGWPLYAIATGDIYV